MTLAHALELRRRCDYRGALAALAGAEDRDSLVARSRLYEDFGNYAAARLDAERAGDPVRLAGVALAERRPVEALDLLREMVCVEAAPALEELSRLEEAEEVYRSLPENDSLARAGRGSVCVHGSVPGSRTRTARCAPSRGRAVRRVVGRGRHHAQRTRHDVQVLGPL